MFTFGTCPSKLLCPLMSKFCQISAPDPPWSSTIPSLVQTLPGLVADPPWSRPSLVQLVQYQTLPGPVPDLVLVQGYILLTKEWGQKWYMCYFQGCTRIMELHAFHSPGTWLQLEWVSGPVWTLPNRQENWECHSLGQDTATTCWCCKSRLNCAFHERN